MLRTSCLLLLFATTAASLVALATSSEWTPLNVEFGQPIAQLLHVALVGRVLLALLPPGHPGDHMLGPRASGGLGATWAASHALGLIALSGLERFWSQMGVASDLTIETIAILALGLVLFWTGPGDLVPRHDERLGPRQRMLTWLAMALGLAPLGTVLLGTSLPVTTSLQSSFAVLSPATAIASFPAGLIAVHMGCRAAGLTPRQALLAVLGLGAAPAVYLQLGHPVTAPLGPGFLAVALTAAGGLAWLRQADRRGATLAALASLSLAWMLPVELTPLAPAFAIAGLIALVSATPPHGRARLGRLLTLTTFLALTISGMRVLTQLPVPAETPSALSEPLRQLLVSWSVSDFGALFILADVIGLIVLFRRPWQSGRLPEPHRLFIFGLAILTCVLPALALLAYNGLFGEGLLAGHVQSALILMAPSALLMVAVNVDCLGRRERA